MKLKFILACLLALIFGSNVLADANDSLALDSELQSEQASNSMTWPILPGESLNDVAHLFYPKNVVMQRIFISKTLHLNTGTQPNLSATQRFGKPTLLLVPTLKSLSKNTQTTQSATDKSAKHRLQIATDIESVLDSVPSKLKEEYQFWVSKNELLKQQLAMLTDKIVFLETKLNNLKLIWEKTLSLPAGDSAAVNAGTNGVTADTSANNIAVIASNTTNSIINSAADASTGTGKKVFKKLNAKPTSSPVSPKIAALKNSNGILDYLDMDWVKAALALGLLAMLSVFLLKKYRERMLEKMNFVTTHLQASVQENIVDLGGYLKPKPTEPEDTPEVRMQAHAVKEVEARLDSTLAEAKVLMSINRHQDAIAHLKLTIESQPKASINHWLYLLEVFRKLNLKDDFEAYAKGLHDIYNVMTPVWYETEISIVVPQSLEEFPHIIEKLCSVWPGGLATVYLRGLITDNRGGDRAGFGKAVLNEILMLIAVLDSRKDLT